MTTMRIGIIGLGRAGSVHLQAWPHVEGAEVVAVCDPSPAARKRAARSLMSGLASWGIFAAGVPGRGL